MSVIQALTRAFTGRRHSADEFERLMSESYRKVYSLALRLAGNPSDAEDLCQEAYIRAFRFFHRYDSSLAFTSWMYRILTNVHIDSLRRRGKVKTTSLDQAGTLGQTWDIADESASPEKLLLTDQLDEQVQLGLMSMSADFRTAVVLADVEGMAYEEIAETMQTSIGTVRSRIHRGRKQLRNYLERACPDRYKELMG